MSTSRKRIYVRVIRQFAECLLEDKYDKAQNFLKKERENQCLRDETLVKKILVEGTQIGNNARIEESKRHTVALLCFKTAYGLAKKPETKSQLKKYVAKAHLYLGALYNKKELLDEAKEHLGKAITNDPSLAVSYNELAMVLIKAGKIKEAKGSCLRALRIDPKYAEAYANLGVALERLDMPDKAEKAYRNAIQADPLQPQAYYNLGALVGEQGRLEEAEVLCKKGVDLAKRDPKAYNNLGVIFGLAGKYRKAERLFEKALGIDSNYLLAYHNLAWILQSLGRLEEAEKACKRAIDLQPNLPEAHIQLASILADLQRFEEAQETCKTAIELGMNDAKLYYETGRILSIAERYKDAEAYLRKAIEIKRDYVKALFTLGGVLYAQDRLEDAARFCRKAIKIKTDEPDAHYNLSLALKETESLHEAEKECRKAIQLNPHDPDYHSLLGRILTLSGKFEEAEEACRIAVGLDPKDFGSWSYIGRTLLDMKRLEPAEDALRKSIRIKPSSRAFNLLGVVRAEKREPKKAIKFFQKAIKLDPKNSSAYNNLGLALAKIGKLNQSEEAYKESIKLNPSFGQAFSNLGCTLADMKRFSEAERAYMQAIDLDPAMLKNVSWNLGLLFFKQAILDNAAKWFSIAEDELSKVNEKEESLRARARILWVHGLKSWRSEDLTNAIEYYNRASALLSEVGEDKLSAVLGIVSASIALDKEYLDALRQDSLTALRDKMQKISLDCQNILKKVDKLYFLERASILAKFFCVEALLKSLTFKPLSFDCLDAARKTFRAQQFWKAVEGVNALENFTVEIGQYRELNDISRINEARLLKMLKPVEMLDGHLNGLIEQKIRETLTHAYVYVSDPIEPTFASSKRREGLRKASLYIGFKPICERIFVDEIDSFRNISTVTAQEAMNFVPLEVSEQKVKELLANVVGEKFVSKDWGGEKSDLYTSNVVFRGRRIATAFLLKGPSVKKLTLDKCGKRGNQILRLVREPACLFIIQHNGEIDSDVVELLETCVSNLSTQKSVKLYYCVMDGVDTSRILLAYGKLQRQRMI